MAKPRSSTPSPLAVSLMAPPRCFSGGADHAGERAGVELGGDVERSGRLRLGHSDRGRAEGASGEARVRRGEPVFAVGAAERDPGAEGLLERRRGRRAAIGDVDQQPVARVEQGLQGDVVAGPPALAGVVAEVDLEERRADRVDRDGAVLLDLVPPGLALGPVVGEDERPALAALGVVQGDGDRPSRYSPTGTVAGSVPERPKTEPSRPRAVACSSTAPAAGPVGPPPFQASRSVPTPISGSRPAGCPARRSGRRTARRPG